MKNIYKSGLVVMVVAALAACGGGDSTEPADKYVGNWKSRCYSSLSTDGNTYNYMNDIAIAKVSAGEVTFTGKQYGFALSDTTCANILATFDRPASKMNIGAETTFLGAKSDSIVLTNLATGEALPGYATATTTAMNLRTYTPGTTPTTWGTASPYTKK